MFAPFSDTECMRDVELLPQFRILNKGNKPQVYLNSHPVFGIYLANLITLITTVINTKMSFELTRRQLCLKVYLQLQS